MFSGKYEKDLKPDSWLHYQNLFSARATARYRPLLIREKTDFCCIIRDLVSKYSHRKWIVGCMYSTIWIFDAGTQSPVPPTLAFMSAHFLIQISFTTTRYLLNNFLFITHVVLAEISSCDITCFGCCTQILVRIPKIMLQKRFWYILLYGWGLKRQTVGSL